MIIYGLKVALLGMGIVFVALLILMFLIQVQSSFLAPKPKRKEELKIADNSNKEQSLAVEIVENDDTDEIAAVISAAIAACGQQVVIKAITRISGTDGSAWAQRGRTEAMNLRQL
ncbi:MAG: hypothetical protein JM58_16940 [Peptococcaceae bacterium BICA1-8]|nr:MAG: hypothetical protein JM58_16940 [Peptococcaceae bacterium BICA1-8]